MIYIAISILLFNLLVVFFKLFEKYNVDNLQALIANYFISGILSLLLLNENDYIASSLNSEWFIHAIILGIFQDACSNRISDPLGIVPGLFSLELFPNQKNPQLNKIEQN